MHRLHYRNETERERPGPGCNPAWLSGSLAGSLRACLRGGIARPEVGPEDFRETQFLWFVS